MTSSPLSSGLASSSFGCGAGLFLLLALFVIVLLNVLAAFCAAEKTDEKKPVCGGDTAVPPGVFASSGWGVSGAEMMFESLLGAFEAERTRLCDIIFPEGETTTLGFDCEALCFGPVGEWVELVGEGLRASTGVGGVTKVVGASTRLGGVEGSWVVMILAGALERSEPSDCLSDSMCIWGGDAWTGSPRMVVSRFLPPKRVPRLVVELRAASVLASCLGEVERRVGLKASLSLPTGEAPRLEGATSMVFAWWRGLRGSRGVVAESGRVASVSVADDVAESSVSEAMRGEDRVRRPAWEWCGEMPGRRSGELGSESQSGPGGRWGYARCNNRRMVGSDGEGGGEVR